jgi:hypothetical protein
MVCVVVLRESHNIRALGLVLPPIQLSVGDQAGLLGIPTIMPLAANPEP